MNFPQLLVTIPFIFSTRATPPLPGHYTETNPYSDFTATLVESIPDSEESNVTQHKIHIKNTGEGYLKSFSILSSEGYTDRSSQVLDSISQQNQVIAPGQEVDVVFDTYYPVESLDDIDLLGYAYTEFTEEVNYTCGRYLERLPLPVDEWFYYRADMVFDVENDQYCYGAIIKTKCGDTDYYFEVDLEDNFNLRASIELKDYDSVEVVKIVKTRYRYISYCDYNCYNDEKEEINPFAIIIPVSSIILVGIGTIVFFSIHSSKKNSNKKDIIS